MRKHDLFALMTMNGTPLICLHGSIYVLVGIEREDGSGTSFNVTLRHQNDNHIITVYMKVTD